MSFTIDWDHIGSDGSQTFGQGTSDEVTVTVSTPKNGEGKQWFVENGMLKNWDVTHDSNADIRFDVPVENVTFTLLDVDRLDEITIMTKDADGNPVPVEFEITGNHHIAGNTITGTSTTEPGPGMDDGSQDVQVTIAGPVSTFWIVLDDGPERHYSGAVAVSDITFDVAAILDGTVEGTDGDDLIDTAYTGDPDGDMVDNNDAILPGDTGNDDLIVAGDGNDTVLAGDGEDRVFGQADDDVIFGGADDDVIYGDRAEGSTDFTVLGNESFNWQHLTEHQIDSTVTQDTGSVSVTYTRTQDTGHHLSSKGCEHLNVDGILSNGVAVDNNDSLKSETKGEGNIGEFQWEFSEPVANVSFNVNDIDFDGVVKITAFDGDGNPIEVVLNAGSKLTLLDTDGVTGADTADSNGGSGHATNADYNLNVLVPGPVSKVVLEHTQDGHDSSGIYVTDIYFDAIEIDETPSDAFGDDTLFGDEGDDVIYGDNGDGNGTAAVDEGGQLSVTLNSQAGAYNGALLAEITSVDGSVRVVELTDNYDHNIGETFTVDLDAGDVVRVGITVPGNTLWSNNGHTVITTDAGEGSTQVAFEDDGGTDFDDLILTATVTGDTALQLPGAIDTAGDVAELIDNGNFDDGLGGWTTLNPTGGQGPTFDAGLNRSIRINAGDETAGGDGIQQTIDTVEGETYVFRADLFTNGGNASVHTVEVEILDADGNVVATETQTVSTGGKENIAFSFVAPGDETTIRITNPTSTNTVGADVMLDNVSVVGLDPALGGDDGEGGDDLIDGGAGADLMFGEGGDDTFVVDDASDADGDVVFGGNGPDQNTDLDTLDLRGAGAVTIDQTADETDAGAFKGTVTFEDGSVLTFAQIEEILTDPQAVNPEANDDTASVDEDSSVTIPVLNNDTDPNGDPLEVIEATSPDGDVIINADGTITFIPNPDFNGETTIEYTITDPDGNTDSATVTVNVAPVNDAPDAINDTVETDEDTPVVIDVLENDIDPDDDPLTITAATVPDNQGTVEIVDGQIVFTPAPDFNGEATISYSITDGNGGTDVAEVVVTVNPVNDAPVAVDDIVETDEGEPVSIPVLENDEDVDGDPLTITDATVPADQGTVEIVDGELIFTPAPGFTGPADITYTIDDGNGGTDEGSVTVNVGDVPGAPVATDDTATTDEDTPVTIDVLDNDSDPDGDPLTITSATVPADQGTVEIVDNELVFTPAPDFNGEATITYAITDGNGGTDIAEAIVTVEPVNDAPTAVDDIDNTDEDEPITLDVLANDVDPEGDDLTLTSADVPADQGTVEIVDNQIVFTPAPGFTGPADITYTIDDGNGGTDEGTATVNVGAVNDSPEAVDDSDTTQEDTPITVDLIANDSDPDGDAVRVINATVPEEQGTLVLNGDGTATFTPAPDFNGEATITYTISDGNGLTDTAEHVINVTPVNDAPVAKADDYVADEDTTEVIGNVLDNDEDPEGDPLTVSEVNGDPNGVGTPQPGDNGGLITIAEDGTVTFDPNGDFDDLRPGESTTTTITYTVTDPDGGEATETVTITVDGINDAPDATDNAYTVDPTDGFGDVDGNVLTDNTGNGQDSDPEGTALKVIAVAGAAAGVGTVVAGDNGGQFIINEDGTVDFNANGDFDNLPLGETAQTSVTYTIEDEDGGTDTATVTFNVNGANDGTIQGTSGDDVITPGYVDADGDIVDGNDAILPGDTGNDDLIFGFEGDDSIDAGDGDDEVFGGIGNDTIAGGVGDDTLMGNEGDDVISGEDGDDRAFGGAGNDAIDGGAGDDVLEGSAGDDVIDGGDGNDDIWGGLDNDTLFGGDGNDTVGGGDGDDVIDTSTPNLDASPDIGYPGLYPADTDPSDDLDTAFGGAGNDSIFTGDDDDTIFGGSGDDTIDAGWDDDEVEGGSGNDTIIGNEGNDEIKGEGGDDLIFGGLDNDSPDFVNIPDDGSGPFGADLVPENNGDTIFGGDGNDTIFGKDDDDTLFGDAGDDVIDGGVDDDIIDGGTGNDELIGGQGDDSILGGDGEDIIIGGEGNDVLAGGFGSDTFLGGNGGDNVVGGEDPDGNDVDVLDLTGTDIESIVYNDGDPESGVVTFQDGTTMTFAEIENVIPCFTPGTMIATPTGEKPVEELRVGDRVITRDNGIQEIAWTGSKVLDGKRLATNPHLKPILIKAGSLGDGLPERDMLVSPNHRVLVASELTQLYFEEREVLAAAKHMTGARGIHSIDAMSTTYIHFMCERHEVVLSNGAWTESFQPGDYSLKGLGNSQRNEIFDLFPELATQEGRENFHAARRMLKKHEARLLMK